MHMHTWTDAQPQKLLIIQFIILTDNNVSDGHYFIVDDVAGYDDFELRVD